MTLYLPIGAPGAGKSTLVAQLIGQGKITPEAVVCPDDFRVLLTGTKADQTANEHVFEIVNRIVGIRLERGLDVWLDATNLAFGPRDSMIAAALHCGQPVVCVPLPMPKVELRRRNLTRPDSVPFDVLDRMFEQFDPAVAAVKYLARQSSQVTVVRAVDLLEPDEATQE